MKGSDKVDHALLMDKMKRLSVHPTLVRWIEPFLSNRKQCMVVDGVKTREEPVVNGVPQGSVLGPVFIIFINDMEFVVCGSSAGIFSDDTKITKRIASIVDHGVLQEDRGSIISWSKRNNMELHEQSLSS